MKDERNAKIKASVVSHKVIRAIKNEIDTDGLLDLLTKKGADATEEDINAGSDDEKVVYHAPATRKKTRSQRNKEREQKELALIEKEEKQMIKLEKQVDK